MLCCLTAILVATILAIANHFPVEISRAASAGITRLGQAVLAGMYVVGMGPSLCMFAVLNSLIAAHTVSGRELLI